MIAAAMLVSVIVAGAQAGVSNQIRPPERDATTQTAKGTGSIKGKVVTADGNRPMRRLQISLSGGDANESRTMSTNAQGLFEFTELPPGRYTLTASRAGYVRLQYGQKRPGENGRPVVLADKQQLTSIDFALPRTSVIVGRITDEVGDPLANASIFPMQWKYFRGQRRLVPVSGGGPFNRTDDTGGFRITGLEPGDYFVMATSRDSWTDEKNSKEKIGFLPTFAPGTATPNDALRVKVGLGQEVVVPDFPLVPGRVGIISGTVTSASGGSLAGESVEMMQEFAGPGTSSSFGAAGAKIAADGSFIIRGVVPGEYQLTVRLQATKDRPAEGTTMTVPMYGEDVTGLVLATSPGGTIRGRVVTDTNQPLPPDQKILVSPRAADGRRNFMRTDPDAGRVREDLTFELPAIYGMNRLTVSSLPAGWVLKSIDYQGKDMADVAVDATHGLNNVTIVLSKSLPHLTGTLLDDNGQLTEGTVLMFPEDPSKWSEESRLTRTARPDSNGTFRFNHVIPGEYLLAPLEYVREGDWADPEFLASLRRNATTVRVDEGATTVPAVALVLRK